MMANTKREVVVVIRAPSLQQLRIQGNAATAIRRDPFFLPSSCCRHLREELQQPCDKMQSHQATPVSYPSSSYTFPQQVSAHCQRKRSYQYPENERVFFKTKTIPYNSRRRFNNNEDTSKMLLSSIYLVVITLFLLLHEGQITIKCLASDPSMSDHLVHLDSVTLEDNDAKFDLNCQPEKFISYREHLNVSRKVFTEKYNKLLRNVTVLWFKDGKPFWRSNGNKVMRLTKFKLALLQIGVSDAGDYSCQLDYSKVDPKVLEYFDSYDGATFRINVMSIYDHLLDVKPSITHPPNDVTPLRNSNVTFRCYRGDTLSHQTTYWFKASDSKNQTSSVANFQEAYSAVISTGDLGPLMPFSIADYHGDELRLSNITFDDEGLYACAVKNLHGVDIRLARLSLVETEYLRALEQPPRHHNLAWISSCIAVGLFLLVVIGIITCIHFYGFSMKRVKKQNSPLRAPLVGFNDNYNVQPTLRQHLPKTDGPDIYNIGKMGDGFISGHLHQGTGHLMTQSINSQILDKEKNPSISSSNSQQSDEAPSSWAKSMSSNGDKGGAFYLHTSNTTTTTVPMYDHPPSTGTFKHFGTSVHDTCVINPTYGFLRPENDVTEWAFPRRNLDRLDKIGEGQFGEVWRFIARQKDGNGNIVAVKQLKSGAGLGIRERIELIAEIEIMKSVNNHPNVIKLLHCCVDEFEPTLLIMEYAENGTLQRYLRSFREPKKSYGCVSNGSTITGITSKELIKFTYHIAKGMEYVASKGIVHRDLASRNILVSKDKICKVADFGFARRVNVDCAYERTTANPVPVKWMAPEALVENKFTSKSDVYSLGILMWEIVTLGATPYEQLSSEGVYKRVSEGGRLERPAHCKDEFYNLMAECWMQNPVDRPTFKEVALQLEKLLLSENDYIELDQYPEHAYYNVVNVEEKEVVNMT